MKHLHKHSHKHTDGEMWASTHTLEVGTAPMMCIKLCGKISGTTREESEENARRIALVWNAFDGISNDDIHSGKYKVVSTEIDQAICDEYKQHMIDLQSGSDHEMIHRVADSLLCDFLQYIGYGDVVTEYKKIDRWYA